MRVSGYLQKTAESSKQPLGFYVFPRDRVLSYFVQREVFEKPPVFDIVDIQPSVDSTKRKQRVVCSIELNRLDARFLAVLTVIGGRCLYPASMNIEIGEPMVGEDIASSLFKQRWRNKVLANFCKPEAGRNTRCTRESNKQHCLLDAVALSSCEDMACLEIFSLRPWCVDVIPDLIPHEHEEMNCFIVLINCVRSEFHRFLRDIWCIAVDEEGRLQILLHFSTYLRRVSRHLGRTTERIGGSEVRHKNRTSGECRYQAPCRPISLGMMPCRRHTRLPPRHPP